MLSLYVHVGSWLAAGADRLRRRMRSEEGQASAEYALVILAAAAVALALITWARSSGRLPAFFDSIIDELVSSTGG